MICYHCNRHSLEAQQHLLEDTTIPGRQAIRRRPMLTHGAHQWRIIKPTHHRWPLALRQPTTRGPRRMETAHFRHSHNVSDLHFAICLYVLLSSHMILAFDSTPNHGWPASGGTNGIDTQDPFAPVSGASLGSPVPPPVAPRPATAGTFLFNPFNAFLHVCFFF